MTDWHEYPKCPYCGSIQELGGKVIFNGTYVCHSCGKGFALQTCLWFRTAKWKEED